MGPPIFPQPTRRGVVTNRPTDLETQDVRGLQKLAETAPLSAPRRKKRPSRAALLERIDILSRWSAPALALIAGISIFLGVTIGRSYPARGTAWAALVLAALWVCRRLHRQYRSGEAISARPFHWRAAYTSCLSVLGVAFACAPILLTPVGAPAGLAFQVVLLVMIGGFAAATLHAAHLASAAAFAAPAIILPALAAFRDGAHFSLVAALSVLGLSIMLALGVLIARNASARNPRTTWLRRDAAVSGSRASKPAAPTATQHAS